MLNKRYTNYYKIIVFQKFLISFHVYTLSESPKTCYGWQEMLEGASTWTLNLFVGGLYSKSYLWGSNSGLVVPSQLLISHKFTFFFPLSQFFLNPLSYSLFSNPPNNGLVPLLYPWVSGVTIIFIPTHLRIPTSPRILRDPYEIRGFLWNLFQTSVETR